MSKFATIRFAVAIIALGAVSSSAFAMSSDDALNLNIARQKALTDSFSTNGAAPNTLRSRQPADAWIINAARKEREQSGTVLR